MKNLILVFLFMTTGYVLYAQEGVSFGKKYSLELGFGWTPYKMYKYTNYIQRSPNYFNGPYKLNFGFVLNRKHEIVTNMQFSHYNLSFMTKTFSGSSLNYFYEGIDLNEIERSNDDLKEGVSKKVNTYSFSINYRVYHGGSIAPFGRYFELGFGYSISNFAKKEDGGAYRIINGEPVLSETLSFNNKAIHPYFQFGYYLKKMLENDWYLTFGTNLRIGLSPQSNPRRENLTAGLYYEYEEIENLLENFFQEQVYWQLKSHEIITGELRIGKSF